MYNLWTVLIFAAFYCFSCVVLFYFVSLPTETLDVAPFGLDSLSALDSTRETLSAVAAPSFCTSEADQRILCFFHIFLTYSSAIELMKKSVKSRILAHKPIA